MPPTLQLPYSRCRVAPRASPPGLGRPSAWPASPPSPAAPQGPKISPNHPPPAYPAGRREPWPGPSQALRSGGRGWPPELGSRPRSGFPQNYLLCVFRQIDSREKRLPYTYPGGGRGGRRARGPDTHTHRPARGTKAKKKRERRGKKDKNRKKKKEKEKKSKRRNTYPRAGQARPKARPALLLTQEEPAVHPPTPSLPWEVRNIGEIEAKDGLPSADRNNKATLLLTGPFRTAKSSAKDLTPLVLKLQYANYRGPLRGPRRNRLLRH